MVGTSSSVDAECSARGERSLKITWAREAGATLEQQMAAASGTEQQRLIASVYAKRGSAPQIRSAVESECMTQKEKLAQAQALAAAAAQTMETVPADMRPRTGESAQGSSRIAVQAADDRANELAARNAREARHVETCARLRDDLAALRGRQRSGGDAQTMDRLNDRRRQLDRSLADERC